MEMQGEGAGHHSDVAVGRRRGAAWVRITRGLHRRADVDDPRLADLLAWQLLFPAEAAFAALTAAELRGWDLPPLPDGLPVCAAMPYGATAPVRPGQLRTTRHRLPPPHDVRRGVRVTTAAETLLTCAPLLGLLDLVVLVDSALRARDIELLELHLICRQHRRGVGRLRRAVALAWLRGTRTLADYDGAVHADRHQQRVDRRRDRRIVDADWVGRSYTDDDLLRRPVAILREADAAVGRPHDPQRIRAWTALFRESSWTEAGRTELAHRHGVRRRAA
jgi:hypothetical protein